MMENPERNWNLEEKEMTEFQFWSRGENSYCEIDVVMVL
jgi:hypothetical protein